MIWYSNSYISLKHIKRCPYIRYKPCIDKLGSDAHGCSKLFWETMSQRCKSYNIHISLGIPHCNNIHMKGNWAVFHYTCHQNSRRLWCKRHHHCRKGNRRLSTFSYSTYHISRQKKWCNNINFVRPKRCVISFFHSTWGDNTQIQPHLSNTLFFFKTRLIYCISKKKNNKLGMLSNSNGS